METSQLSSNWERLKATLQKKKSSDNKKSVQLPGANGHHTRVVKKGHSLSALSKHRQPSKDTPQTKQKMGAVASALGFHKEEKPSGKSTNAAPTNSTKPAPTSLSGQNVRLSTMPSPDSLHSPQTPATARHPDALNAGRSSLEPGKYVALDCEMVGVGPSPDANSMLARASLVDYHGTQLYDSFVAPKEAITDYRTAISGITPALLREARPFETGQRDVASLLEGRILVGHAVRHDLNALMLGHPRTMIRDTADHAPYQALNQGRKPGLRFLAKELLGLDIQGGSHSSVEDARATMALFRRDRAGFESAAGVGRSEGLQKKQQARAAQRAHSKKKKRHRGRK